MYINWRLVWYVTLRINHAAKGVHNLQPGNQKASELDLLFKESSEVAATIAGSWALILC